MRAAQTQLGAPLWLSAIVALLGACAAAMALMRNATHFMVLRFLLGLFEAGTFPGIWYAPVRILLPLLRMRRLAARRVSEALN